MREKGRRDGKNERGKIKEGKEGKKKKVADSEIVLTNHKNY